MPRTIRPPVISFDGATPDADRDASLRAYCSALREAHPVIEGPRDTPAALKEQLRLTQTAARKLTKSCWWRIQDEGYATLTFDWFGDTYQIKVSGAPYGWRGGWRATVRQLDAAAATAAKALLATRATEIADEMVAAERAAREGVKRAGPGRPRVSDEVKRARAVARKMRVIDPLEAAEAAFHAHLTAGLESGEVCAAIAAGLPAGYTVEYVPESGGPPIRPTIAEAGAALDADISAAVGEMLA
jgi:hypothetical protein